MAINLDAKVIHAINSRAAYASRQNCTIQTKLRHTNACLQILFKEKQMTNAAFSFLFS